MIIEGQDTKINKINFVLGYKCRDPSQIHEAVKSLVLSEMAKFDPDRIFLWLASSSFV